MQIKLNAKIKNFDIEIIDNLEKSEDLKTWRKTVIKELNYLNLDIEEKKLNEQTKEEKEIVEVNDVKLITPAQINLLKRLGLEEIDPNTTMDEANILIKEMKKRANWR